MKSFNLKLLGVLVASISMLCTGPAWSASTASHKKVKSAYKHKLKHKLKHRTVSKKALTAAAAVALPAVAVAAETAVAPVGYAPAGYAPATPAVNPYLPPAGNPYLAYQQQVTPVNPWENASQLGNNLKSLLPHWQDGQSILPTFKKVYPTGEKPLVVITFKCPTELIGITPIPTKILHEVVNGGMNVVNASNLLSFNMQQVCQ